MTLPHTMSELFWDGGPWMLPVVISFLLVAGWSVRWLFSKRLDSCQILPCGGLALLPWLFGSIGTFLQIAHIVTILRGRGHFELLPLLNTSVYPLVVGFLFTSVLILLLVAVHFRCRA